MHDGALESKAILANWHLVDIDADEIDLPQPRVDLAIRRTELGLTGAILSRRDGSDVGLLIVEREGPTLRFQMRVSNQEGTAEPPWLVLQETHERFEGRWHDAANEAIGPVLKLIRARNLGRAGTASNRRLHPTPAGPDAPRPRLKPHG